MTKLQGFHKYLEDRKKSIAQKSAKKMRDRGYNARVIKSTRFGMYMYEVWIKK